MPFHKGNFCFFFALYDGRLDRLGSTIHFVDAGLDTGDVIDLVQVTYTIGDYVESLYCRAERAAIDRLVELLNREREGLILPRTPQPKVGRTYRVRD